MNAPIPRQVLSTQPYSKWFEVHPGLGISMMDHLFNRLDGAYPHKWRSNFPNQQAIDNWCESWAEAFEEEGITPTDVKAGLKACRSRYDWPPSCAEFIKACKPMVDPMVAYYEAVNGVNAREKGEVGKWSHPAIFWAAAGMAYDLKHMGHSAIKERWEKALAEQMEKGSWPEIPPVLIALPAPGKTKADREHAERMMKQYMGAAPVIQNGGHRRWIDKVMQRQEQRDETLPGISVRMALEAKAERLA